MVDLNGVHRGVEHPMSIIADAMSSGQLIYLSQGHSVTRACLPIQTPDPKIRRRMDGHSRKPWQQISSKSE